MTAQELLQRYAAGERNFDDVELRGVELSYQDLRGIQLYGADVTGAKLVNANLGDADLRYARCDGADLHNANLTGSNRKGWTTEGANLWSIFASGEARTSGGSGNAGRAGRVVGTGDVVHWRQGGSIGAHAR